MSCQTRISILPASASVRSLNLSIVSFLYCPLSIVHKMKYRSTRGGIDGVTFEDALFAGYAPDGGLYVPETLPKISENLLAKWKVSLPKYQEVVFEVVKLFVGEEELPRNVLQDSVDGAYATFDTDKVVELHECKGPASDGSPKYTVVELFHGRTKSFKDYALSLVGRLMEYYVNKRGKHVTILVGTSGDTGSAALEAVKGLKGIDIIVLYPLGKISEVQELQMITVTENNVHVFQTEGTSDDLDVPIKKCFPAPGLTSINSLNWARIMMQTAHYIYLCGLEHWEPVDIYVPTGAAGNIVSGLVASLLGFPINLYSAQNANNNVETLINKGKLVYGGNVVETYANAMDIRHAYNLERILYFLSDSDTVAEAMKGLKLQDNEKVGTIPADLHEKVRKSFKGAMRVDTDAILKNIRNCWETNKYLICPHTATAVTLFLSNVKNGKSQNKSFVIATASPEKFPDAAKAANLTNIDLTDGSLLKELRARQRKQPKIMKKGEDWFEILQAEIKLVREAAGAKP